MLPKNKSLSAYIYEILFVSLTSALLLRDIIIRLIFAIIPTNLIIPFLSSLLLISAILIILNIIVKIPFLPFWITSTLFFVIIYFCVVHQATYLPNFINIAIFAICVIWSFQVIKDFFSHRSSRFLYQFEMMNKIKIQLFVLYIVNIFLIFSEMASGNKLYFLFLLLFIPLFWGAITFQNHKKNNKILYLLIPFSIIGMCFYNYLTQGDYFNGIFQMSIVLSMFICRNYLDKKITAYAMAILLAFIEMNIYFKFLSFFPNIINNIIDITSIFANMITIAVVMIKIKPLSTAFSFKNISSLLNSKYTKQDIQKAIEIGIQQSKDDKYIDSSLYLAIEYIEIKELMTITQKTKNDLDELDAIDKITENEFLPQSDSFFRKKLYSATLHWRLFLAILYCIVWLSMFNIQINEDITRILNENGKVAIVYDAIRQSHYYAEGVIHRLQDGESVDNTNIKSFAKYFSDYYSSKANSYIVSDSNMRLMFLSASLQIQNDYERLYERYILNSQLGNNFEALNDINLLLSMNECEEEDAYLLKYNRSVYFVLLGDFEKAYEDAKFCCQYDSDDKENEAWLYACNIGIGKPKEAFDSLNTFIKNNPEQPFWVFRMRGLALLTLLEKGESQDIKTAQSDIEYAYLGEKTTNNALAYARLCLYIKENQEAFKVIQSVFDEDPNNGWAYYWLSKYFETIGDVQNQKTAIEQSRRLNYHGNGEY